MEMRDLLEKMMKFAGEKIGQKPGDQWRGDDPNPPGKKLVGDSILKDLSKGPTPKSKEQELAEEFQAFLEAEFKDTVDKRPGRKSDRHPRGHEPKPRYKTIKADESAMSEKDIELQDYRSMSHKEFQTAYGMTKTEWINKNKALVIQNPDIKRSLGINESHYKWVISFKDGKQAIYHQRSPHYSDASAASDIEYTLQANRGSKLELATKDDLAFNWQSFLSEGWESGPEEYKEPYDDADDAYERQRQEKIDTEAEREWAKLPKVSTYKLVGRGPNMEPNYAFPGEYDTQGAAIEARGRLMADPETPHPEHIGIQTLTRVVDKPQTNEAIDSDIVQPMGQDTFNRAGYNPLRDERDYLDTLSKLTNLSRKPGLDKSMQDHITQRIRDLNAEAFKKGFIKAESRGHKIIATKLKDIERGKKFASGELKIPTPQERQAQLKKLETEPKQVKEYGASNPPQKTSPAQVQQAAANLNIQKTALNQLKQINPEIDPAKAASAMTKDPATMSPQEKDELAQVAKTVGPALGTPAFGSIKTAIQKSQIK